MASNNHEVLTSPFGGVAGSCPFGGGALAGGRGETGNPTWVLLFGFVLSV